MKQINNFSEMKNNELYCYNEKNDKKHTFRFENVDYLDFVSLYYKDGYVGEPPKENFQRQIEEGKVYKI